MKVVALVPIKLNNERFQGKNTKILHGKPMMSYLQETLLKVDEISEVYVYCSSEDVKQYLLDGVKFLKRSSELDTAQTKCGDILGEFTKEIVADVYLLAHVTAPFTNALTIKKCIEMVKSAQYDSALAVRPVQEFLWKNSAPINHDPQSIPRTQDLESIYAETTGLYVFERDVFTVHGRRVGFTPYLHEVSPVEAVDVDEPIDFTVAEAIAPFINGER